MKLGLHVKENKGMWRAAGEGGEDEWTPSTAERERERGRGRDCDQQRESPQGACSYSHIHRGIHTHRHTESTMATTSLSSLSRQAAATVCCWSMKPSWNNSTFFKICLFAFCGVFFCDKNIRPALLCRVSSCSMSFVSYTH